MKDGNRSILSRFMSVPPQLNCRRNEARCKAKISENRDFEILIIYGGGSPGSVRPTRGEVAGSSEKSAFSVASLKISFCLPYINGRVTSISKNARINRTTRTLTNHLAQPSSILRLSSWLFGIAGVLSARGHNNIISNIIQVYLVKNNFGCYNVTTGSFLCDLLVFSKGEEDV